MLPFSEGFSIFSFIGPLLDLEEAEQACPFFPYMKNRDVIASQDKIHCRYFTSSTSLFRNNPKNTDDYIKWLDKIEPSMEKTWNLLGIYEFIQLSWHPLQLNPAMIGASFYFRNRTINTLQISYSMVGPMLFEVAAITRLRPTGKVIMSNMSLKEPVWLIWCSIIGTLRPSPYPLILKSLFGLMEHGQECNNQLLINGIKW